VGRGRLEAAAVQGVCQTEQWFRQLPAQFRRLAAGAADGFSVKAAQVYSFATNELLTPPIKLPPSDSLPRRVSSRPTS
jgi:hypothetical protein